MPRRANSREECVHGISTRNRGKCLRMCCPYSGSSVAVVGKHIVLSNHVPELPRLTEALGLSSFLIDVYCSGRTGAEKPHPKAFEPVFADHPEARAGWMIGDSWRADVQGAMAVGMRSILVREKHPGALLQCDRLYDIAEIVGGA